jgi:hypothetical protein
LKNETDKRSYNVNGELKITDVTCAKRMTTLIVVTGKTY